LGSQQAALDAAPGGVYCLGDGWADGLDVEQQGIKSVMESPEAVSAMVRIEGGIRSRWGAVKGQLVCLAQDRCDCDRSAGRA
jgi:hypothetical protein